MAHMRSQIIDALTTLVTGLTTTGANVFKGRDKPLQSTELPALLVYMDNEQIEHASIGRPRLQNRLAQAVIRIISTAGDDSEINASLTEIETALVAGIDSVSHDARLVSISVEREFDASPPTTSATLVIECEYRTLEGVPESLI